MFKIYRDKGDTVIELPFCTIRRKDINRDRYNDIRKKVQELDKLLEFSIRQGKRR